MAASRSAGELFVVYGEDDEGHAYQVSLDEPSAIGAKRTDYGAKLHLLIIPRRWRARRAPRSDDRVRAVVGLSVPVTIVVTAILLFTAPLWAAGAALCGIPAATVLLHLTHRTRTARHWPDRHLVLHQRQQVDQFARAFRAARRILTLWPEMRLTIDDAMPRQEITESLWTLAKLLDQHVALNAALPDIDLARAALPPEATTERTGLVRRHSEIIASLDRQRTDIAQRIEWLESLAAECGEFVHFERAVNGAREVMARTDRLLGPASPVALAQVDPIRDLAERIRFTIAAYQNLPRPYDA